MGFGLLGRRYPPGLLHAVHAGERLRSIAYAEGASLRCSTMKRLVAALLLIALLASCAASQSSVRKCNGKRGTRVPMGVM